MFSFLILLPLALAGSLSATSASSAQVLPTTTTSTIPPFATTTDWPSVPKGAVYFDPPRGEGRGRRLHPLGRSDLCVSVQPEDNEIKSGAAVEISYCHSNDSPYSDFQLWNFSDKAQFKDEYITLGNTTQVLDAVNGKLLLNEVGIHDQGQKWGRSIKGYWFTSEGCLTFKNGSKADCALPWGKVRDLAQDKCQGDASDQVFYLLPYEDELNY